MSGRHLTWLDSGFYLLEEQTMTAFVIYFAQTGWENLFNKGNKNDRAMANT